MLQKSGLWCMCVIKSNFNKQSSLHTSRLLKISSDTVETAYNSTSWIMWSFERKSLSFIKVFKTFLIKRECIHQPLSDSMCWTVYVWKCTWDWWTVSKGVDVVSICLKLWILYYKNSTVLSKKRSSCFEIQSRCIEKWKGKQRKFLKTKYESNK